MCEVRNRLWGQEQLTYEVMVLEAHCMSSSLAVLPRERWLIPGIQKYLPKYMR